jgi:hypothetical protein
MSTRAQIAIQTGPAMAGLGFVEGYELPALEPTEPEMTKLTETQTIILSAGAQRPDNIALPLPKGLHGAAAKMTIAKMIEYGWLQEVEANLRRGEPLWRETGDGHGTTLVVTDAGLLAIGIEPVVVKTVVAIRKYAAKAAVPKPSSQRKRTKQELLIARLNTPGGATITEIMGMTGWQAHTVRGAISGALGRKLGLLVVSAKEEGRGRVYKLEHSRRQNHTEN